MEIRADATAPNTRYFICLCLFIFKEMQTHYITTLTASIGRTNEQTKKTQETDNTVNEAGENQRLGHKSSFIRPGTSWATFMHRV